MMKGLTFNFKLVWINNGKPLSCAPTRDSSLGGIKPTIPTLYSVQYLSRSSRFHLSICRYLLKFSKTITPYFPLSKFVKPGNDLPATSTLYLKKKKKKMKERKIIKKSILITKRKISDWKKWLKAGRRFKIR